MAGCRVPYHVRGYRSVSQSRYSGRTTLDKAVDPEAGKRRSEPADEYGVFVRTTEVLVCQDALGFRPQWTLARLTALTVQGGEIVPAVPAPDLQIAAPEWVARRLCPGVVEEQKRVYSLRPRWVLRSGMASIASISALVSHPTGGGMDLFERWPGCDRTIRHGRIPAADEARERPDGGKPLIAGPGGAPRSSSRWARNCSTVRT